MLMACQSQERQTMSGNNIPINITDEDDDEYTVVPVINGGNIHNDIGFCYDMSHECHENPDAIQELHQYHQDGLASDADRDNIYHGRTR
jgi:hypothetical protein